MSRLYEFGGEVVQGNRMAAGSFLGWEVPVVGARWLLILTASMASAIFVGCGDEQSATFVLSERTEKLAAARRAVRDELQQSFGDPHHLVAWPKLPVDFGQFEGTVEAPGKRVGDAFVFSARLDRGGNSKVPFEPDAIHDAGLLWTTGTNKDVVAQVNGKDTPIEFQIESYTPDPKQPEVRVRVLPGSFAENLQPPQPREKFTVLGPVLQHGRKLYMTQCEHCHGVSGDGAGPTAAYFDIKPRDYRQGKFKFTSTKSTERARRDDLARTIHQGIPGTYMPSFLWLKEDELGAVIEYVRWLAMRGEMETKTDVEFEAEQYGSEAISERVKGGETQQAIDAALSKYITSDLPRVVNEKVDELAAAWTSSEQSEAIVIPKQARTPDSEESRQRGRKLFLSETAKCSTCHGPIGRGDGSQTEDYQTIPGTNKKYATAGLFDDWGNPIRPRDLTAGVYRGGRRPLDLYRRVFSGIKGTPMPPFGTALKENEIWDLVNYVMSIPYEKGSEYPEERPQQTKIASNAEGSSHREGGN